MHIRTTWSSLQPILETNPRSYPWRKRTRAHRVLFHINAIRRTDPEAWDILVLRDLLQVARVAAVEPPHHEHDVHRRVAARERVHRVLPLLHIPVSAQHRLDTLGNLSISLFQKRLNGHIALLRPIRDDTRFQGVPKIAVDVGAGLHRAAQAVQQIQSIDINQIVDQEGYQEGHPNAWGTQAVANLWPTLPVWRRRWCP